MSQEDSGKDTIQEKKFWRAEKLFYLAVIICAGVSTAFMGIVAFLLFRYSQKSDFPEPVVLAIILFIFGLVVLGSWVYISCWQEKRHRELKELFLRLRNTDASAEKILQEVRNDKEEERARRVEWREKGFVYAGVAAVLILAVTGVIAACVKNTTDSPIGVFAALIAAMTAIFVVFGFVMYGRSREMREELKEVRREADNSRSKLLELREEAKGRIKEINEEAKEARKELASQMDSFLKDQRKKTEELESLDKRARHMRDNLNISLSQQVSRSTGYSDDFQKGLKALEEADYYTAIEHFSNCIEHASSAAAYSNRGLAKNELGRHRDAISDYDKAIRLNPKNAVAFNNRGTANYELGRHEDAISDFAKAIRLDPKNAFAYNNRGNSKNELGRHEDAISDFDDAIRLDPKYALTYYNRVAALLKLADQKPASEEQKLLKDAEQMCEKARELSGNEFGFYKCACVAARLGKEDECKKWLEMSIGKDCPSREHVEKDEDLKSVRDRDWFKQLLEKMASRRWSIAETG